MNIGQPSNSLMDPDGHFSPPGRTRCSKKLQRRSAKLKQRRRKKNPGDFEWLFDALNL
jgi:hypothetical protein